MAEVRLVGLTKYFGDTRAVRELTLHVPDRSFVTLLGPSGCGKSTVLNVIAGLESPSRGEIYLDGQLITKVPPAARDVAMAFQSYALYPHMTVRDNLAFALKVRKLPKSEIDERVEEVAKLLAIEDLLRRKPRHLSGGQRQRVAIGRAIVRDPRVFLLDEPLSNLDAALRVQMRGELKLLFSRIGATVIYVTHDQAEAMTMSDRVAVMRDGQLQQVGSPLEIYHNPVNRFVAGFVGSPAMNFLPAVATAEGGVVRARTADFALDVPRELLPAQRLAGTQELILGIRPEDARVLSSPVGTAVPGTCVVVERTGAASILLVQTGKHTLTLQVPGSAPIQPGENLAVEIDPHKLYFFDARTEAAIATPAHASVPLSSAESGR